MNVKELIAKLKTLPQDSMVVISGYEGGVEEVAWITECMAQLNVNNVWYYGPHKLGPDGDTPVVYIS